MVKKMEEETNLLGSPTFVDIGNGRLRCVETGHEVVAGDEESYSGNKRCRVGLIDHAVSQGKPPLNMFSQHPLYRSKLVCKLTGDTVNKNEDHIWKHVNGRRFLHKLEQVEMGNGTQVTKPRRDVRSGDMRKIKKEVISAVRDKNESDSDEPDFWMPRGKQRSSSGSESELETDEGNSTDAQCEAMESEELLERTKRMSIEIGPSSFASRKKKSRNHLS